MAQLSLFDALAPEPKITRPPRKKKSNAVEASPEKETHGESEAPIDVVSLAEQDIKPTPTPLSELTNPSTAETFNDIAVSQENEVKYQEDLPVGPQEIRHASSPELGISFEMPLYSLPIPLSEPVVATRSELGISFELPLMPVSFPSDESQNQATLNNPTPKETEETKPTFPLPVWHDVAFEMPPRVGLPHIVQDNTIPVRPIETLIPAVPNPSPYEPHFELPLYEYPILSIEGDTETEKKEVDVVTEDLAQTEETVTENREQEHIVEDQAQIQETVTENREQEFVAEDLTQTEETVTENSEQVHIVEDQTQIQETVTENREHELVAEDLTQTEETVTENREQEFVAEDLTQTEETVTENREQEIVPEIEIVTAPISTVSEVVVEEAEQRDTETEKNAATGDHVFQKLTKHYYSISEVAAMFQVNTSHLRYWEKEFPEQLGKLRKNGKGDRFYTPKNIEQLREIFHLVRNMKMTLEGAREQLKLQKRKRKQEVTTVEHLQQVKRFLVELKNQLDS